VHVAIGKEHRSEHISWIAQVENDIRVLQGRGWNKKPKRTETAISLGNEIVTIEDLVNGQLPIDAIVIGRVVYDMIFFANFSQHSMEYH
jgi:hypothetical protein